MSTHDNPKQLFDYFLSSATGDSWKRKSIAPRDGCEVVVSNGAAELAAMIEQFNPDETGWHVLLMEIPGFKGNEWSSKGETLRTLISQLTPKDAQAWAYLLGGMQLAILVRIPAKDQLVAFVQKLGAALGVGQGSPRTRLAEVPAQKQVVRDYLITQAASAETAKRQQ